MLAAMRLPRLPTQPCLAVGSFARVVQKMTMPRQLTPETLRKTLLVDFRGISPNGSLPIPGVASLGGADGDRAMFPELNGRRTVKLFEIVDGFVVEVY
jgi:hypothetical protein